ncbi:RagB/SusD family nutrient uptake outer membrane protein [Flavivirga spongiicola]|uniref:RagB/SusD family nutrient uptake outer membrane protein n=1 Tax=Flavivirga spongiicola TaxID=421621 RepID=A0ABU7XWS4_9FLAO|nr:RagB/SusD family nutrient uptake outer membrane protein [Flavivirga sp. MEBiC05379]MDO5980228.1 RagB/SusD family nutrient uptake outer membrane protein [Flavivirga sp. MEBiC05379]
MKNIKTLITFSLLLLFITACNDDFLEKLPQDSLAETNTFSTNSAIQAYAWQFYEMFEAHNERTEIRIDGDLTRRPGTGFGLNREADADLIQINTNGTGRDYIWGRVTLSGASDQWNVPYRQIRAANLLLKNVPDSNLEQIDKDHWLSVGLFFKAFNYFNLMKTYGDVPWLEELATNESEELFGPRTPRDEVAANILRDLLWAEAHIKDNVTLEKKEVDKSVVNALISQFGLFEGTWRKYHNLSNATTYLEASVTASEKLINEFPNLHPKFDELHNSESLNGVNGIILYKEYNEEENWSNMSTTFRASNSTWDITRKGIDKFLTKDGLSVTNPTTPEYQADRDMFAEFRNRDNRLLYMTPAPYFVTRVTNTTWTSTGNPADEEYFSVYESISDNLHKSLPDLNWRGNLVSRVPNFNQNRVAGFNRTFSGYRVWRHYNQHNTGTSSADFADAPIYRMGEILVNYAEATFELGQFNQSIADQTINKLRVRGEVAPIVIGNIDASFDPTGDPGVDPVLFEIRRERAIELMAEGFRREDLRRWKKMDYASEVKLGRWITAASQNNRVPIQNDASEGYVQTVPGTPPAFSDHYYLFPLPTDQLVINPQLEQNPGW